MLLVVALGAEPLHADFVWTGAAGNGLWTDPMNWIDAETMTVGGTPSLMDGAIFATSASVAGGFAGGLSVASGVMLTLGNETISTTGLQGDFLNDGLVRLSEFGVPQPSWPVQSITVLPVGLAVSGSGVLELTGPQSGLSGVGSGTVFSNHGLHTVRGAGVWATIEVHNRSMFHVVGGDMTFISVSIDNEGGEFEIASDGVLQLGGMMAGGGIGPASFTGGIIRGLAHGALIAGEETDPGSVHSAALEGDVSIRYVELVDPDIQGVLRVIDAESSLVGNAINSGTIVVAPGVLGPDGYGGGTLRVGGASTTTLSGSGSLLLGGEGSRIRGFHFGPTHLVLGAGQELSGTGELYEVLMLNRGSIVVGEQDSLLLRQTQINSDGGSFEIRAGGSLLFENSTLRDVNLVAGAGTTDVLPVDTGPGDELRLERVTVTGDIVSYHAELEDVTLHGDLTIPPVAIARRLLTVRGVLENNGTISPEGGGVPGWIGFESNDEGAPVLTGTGMIDLNSGAIALRGSFVHEDGHSIVGPGEVSYLGPNSISIVTNRGIIDPNGGILRLGGMVNERSPFVLESGEAIELGRGGIVGGVLDLHPGTYIEALVDDASLRQLTLVGEHRLYGVGLEDVTNNASEVVLGGRSIGTIRFGGTIQNNSVIRLVDDGVDDIANADQIIFLQQHTVTTLAGDGALVVETSDFKFDGNSPLGVLVNSAGHTIELNGGDALRVDLENQGLVVLRSGRTDFRFSSVSGAGSFEIESDATLVPPNNFAAGSVVNDGLVAADQFFSAQDLVNNGTLSFDEQGQDATLLASTFTNHGLFEVFRPLEVLFSGQLVLERGGVLRNHFGQTGVPFSTGRFMVSADAQLDGVMQVVVDPDFLFDSELHPGDSFELLHAQNGIELGETFGIEAIVHESDRVEFESNGFVLTPLAQDEVSASPRTFLTLEKGVFSASLSSDTTVLRLTYGDPGCAADFDGDGAVSLGDFGLFGSAFGSMQGDAEFQASADFNGDGKIDLGDFGFFGAQFGRTDCND